MITIISSLWSLYCLDIGCREDAGCVIAFSHPPAVLLLVMNVDHVSVSVNHNDNDNDSDNENDNDAHLILSSSYILAV